ncbi:MAG: zinc ABC transporter substrate-binding protein [Deltaproteobacteria bacterium]|nr:zinc ABC transporter substrate-binding protein [Deltaproteobacteria bacterium]
MMINKRINFKNIIILGALFSIIFSANSQARQNGKLYVVTTITDYAYITREIGGDKVISEAIAKGDEDPHFVRPKPSFAEKLSKADLFISTGLDLELWAPGLVDKSQNASIRDGEVGYVAAADGIKLLEIPAVIDRSSGGVHIHGNPHINTDPLNMKIVASNIAIGLKKVDPENSAYYLKRLKSFQNQIDERMFGKELVDILGGKTLTHLAQSGNLISFLEQRDFGGVKLISKLGGWMKQMLPLRGKKIVTYHKTWVYFSKVFGIDVIGEVEPKPAIPPSPRDVERLENNMKKLDVKVVLAANFYNENNVKKICDSVGAKPVIVGFLVDSEKGVDSYFKLVDRWINALLDGYGIK